MSLFSIPPWFKGQFLETRQKPTFMSISRHSRTSGNVIVVTFLDIYRPQWPLSEELFRHFPTSFDLFQEISRKWSIPGLGYFRISRDFPEMSQMGKWTRF